MMNVRTLNSNSREKMISEAFNSFKMSGYETIDRENLTKAFTKFGIQIKDAELDEIFKDSPDGTINYQQFKLLVL